MRASRIAAIVAPCLLLAACGSIGNGASSPAAVRTAPSLGAATSAGSAVPNPNGGIGSTIDVMAQAHGHAVTPTGPCSTANACFGSSVANTESGTTVAFTNVVQVNDLVGGYHQNFPTGTSWAKAVSQVLHNLPPDARVSALTTISGTMTSCAYFNVSSPTLAGLFPSGAPNDPFGSTSGATVGVELSTTSAQGFTFYEPGNVQQAQLKLGGDDSSMAC